MMKMVIYGHYFYKNFFSRVLDQDNIVVECGWFICGLLQYPSAQLVDSGESIPIYENHSFGIRLGE